ncbi:MAG: RtcB family protein [Actinobacteria bacterium]|nr:RtcB family protein [Actinomycetota bacterium]
MVRAPRQLSDKVVSWASIIDDVTAEQAVRTARLPVIEGHVALMPDAHLGLGATIGSVIPTRSAIIPSAVGVDIGCGMIAAETTVSASQLPDDMDPLVPRIERVVPAGLGRWRREPTGAALAWLAEHPNPRLTSPQERRALEQIGSLGSGNHFFEVCLDETDRMWVVMHSGSRGVGNQLAEQHIEVAKRLAKAEGIPLEDPELAWLQEGTPEFGAYVADMLWAQAYAMENRRAMMEVALREILRFVGTGLSGARVNCHHNFAALEEHGGRKVWVTRKGAIRAERGDLGVIPGAMGGKSYIVRGLGNELAYNSCAHGAGRAMSRRAARRTFTPEDLEKAMAGRAWQAAKARELLDEIPGSYKDIDRVMEDQKDLVEIVHRLHGIVSYKGTS